MKPNQAQSTPTDSFFAGSTIGSDFFLYFCGMMKRVLLTIAAVAGFAPLDYLVYLYWSHDMAGRLLGGALVGALAGIIPRDKKKEKK